MGSAVPVFCDLFGPLMPVRHNFSPNILRFLSQTQRPLQQRPALARQRKTIEQRCADDEFKYRHLRQCGVYNVILQAKNHVRYHAQHWFLFFQRFSKLNFFLVQSSGRFAQTIRRADGNRRDQASPCGAHSVWRWEVACCLITKSTRRLLPRPRVSCRERTRAKYVIAVFSPPARASVALPSDFNRLTCSFLSIYRAAWLWDC